MNPAILKPIPWLPTHNTHTHTHTHYSQSDSTNSLWWQVKRCYENIIESCSHQRPHSIISLSLPNHLKNPLSGHITWLIDKTIAIIWKCSHMRMSLHTCALSCFISSSCPVTAAAEVAEATSEALTSGPWAVAATRSFSSLICTHTAHTKKKKRF